MVASLVPADYTIADLQEAAREKLPRETYEFFETGARDEITAHENTCAWQSYWLVPRVLVDVSSVRTATEVLGQPIDFPVLAAPMSVLGLAHPEGDVGLVRGTAAAGTIAIISQTSLSSLDEIAQVPGARFWAQHYPVDDREVNAEMIQSAIGAGAGAIVVTVDFPLRGVTRARPRGGFVFPPNDRFPASAARAQPILTSPTMDYIDWLQQIVAGRMPIVVKGVLHPNDAVRLVDHSALVHGQCLLVGRWCGAWRTPVKPVSRTSWAVSSASSAKTPLSPALVMFDRFRRACSGKGDESGRGIQPLDDEELMAMCVGLLLGGYETTRNLIGNLMLRVLQRTLARLEVEFSPLPVPADRAVPS